MMHTRNRLHRIGRFLFDCLFGLSVTGAAGIPRKGPVIFVSNHISELDPPVLGSCIPRQTWFMAKLELFTTRLGEFYLPRIGAYPVNRDGVDTDALRTGIEVLRRGFALVVFPEGTRSTDGRLLPVKPGIGLIASRAAVPVVPAYIRGTDHPVRSILRKDRFRVTFGQLISPDRIAELSRTGGSRRVADFLMEEIAALA